MKVTQLLNCIIKNMTELNPYLLSSTICHISLIWYSHKVNKKKSSFFVPFTRKPNKDGTTGDLHTLDNISASIYTHPTSYTCHMTKNTNQQLQNPIYPYPCFFLIAQSLIYGLHFLNTLLKSKQISFRPIRIRKHTKKRQCTEPSSPQVPLSTN